MKSLQLDKPHAIVMVGIAGSGKTFFAHKFAEMFNAPYIDQSALYEHARDDQSAFELAKLLLGEVVKTKRSVILELDTSTKTSRLELSRALKKAGYTPLFVWVQIDHETAQNRSMKNNAMSAGEHDELVRRFSPPATNERPLVISGKHTYATQARIVLKKLSTPRAEVAAQPQRPTTPPRGQIFIR